MNSQLSITEGLLFTIVELFGTLAILVQVPEYSAVARGVLAAFSYTCVGFSLVMASRIETCYMVPYGVMVASLTAYLFVKRGGKSEQTLTGCLTVTALMVVICILISEDRGKLLLVPMLLWVTCIVVRRISDAVPRRGIQLPNVVSES